MVGYVVLLFAVLLHKNYVFYVGAIRYMAPEVLDGTINITQFEPFKQADMYSLALVLWEATRRCEVFGT